MFILYAKSWVSIENKHPSNQFSLSNRKVMKVATEIHYGCHDANFKYHYQKPHRSMEKSFSWVTYSLLSDVAAADATNLLRC